MARINVEDAWFLDLTGRRKALVAAVAKVPQDPEQQADGLALAAWRLAQHYWKDNEQLIPEDVWRRRGFEPMIDAGLAERRSEGVYVRGAAEQHDWLKQKVEAGKRGGERSGESRRGEKARSDASAKRSTREASLRENDQNGQNSEAMLRKNEAARSGANPPAPAPAPALSNNPHKPPLNRRERQEVADRFAATAVKVGVAGCEAFKAGLRDKSLFEWVSGQLDEDLRGLIIAHFGSTEQFLRDLYQARLKNTMPFLTRDMQRAFKALLFDAEGERETTGPPEPEPGGVAGVQ